MSKFPPHPAALLMPRPDEDEYKQLEADILANGLIDPIELYDGMVIDGVTRQDICLKHGLEMSSNYLPIDEHSLGPHRCPYRYVLSKNTRRSLTAGQLAMVAAGLKEAKSGSLKAIKNGKIPTSAAAAAVGVDRKLVKEAEIVRAKGSETVIKAVEEKGMSVSVAKKLVEVTPNKEEQDRVVQAGKEEVKRRISGGTSFDVEEIEGAEAEPGKKPKNGAPLVSSKDRKEAVKACDVLIRWLNKLGVYEEFMKPVSAIRERLIGLK